MSITNSLTLKKSPASFHFNPQKTTLYFVCIVLFTLSLWCDWGQHLPWWGRVMNQLVISGITMVTNKLNILNIKRRTKITICQHINYIKRWTTRPLLKSEAKTIGTTSINQVVQLSLGQSYVSTFSGHFQNLDVCSYISLQFETCPSKRIFEELYNKWYTKEWMNEWMI